jgi:hypothetical protein
MKALISPFEHAMDPTDKSRTRILGERVVQVVADDQTFDVGPGMFWTVCPNDCVADRCYYDKNDNTVKNFPPPPAQ